VGKVCLFLCGFGLTFRNIQIEFLFLNGEQFMGIDFKIVSINALNLGHFFFRAINIFFLAGRPGYFFPRLGSTIASNVNIFFVNDFFFLTELPMVFVNCKRFYRYFFTLLEKTYSLLNDKFIHHFNYSGLH
jgi:hypothetical protein